MEFEKIYNTYFNDVFRYIRKLSNNEHIAEEITADTFFKAMHSIDSFPDGIELLNIADPSETVEEKLVKNEEGMQIQKILHDIPAPYKEVFMWRVFAELSFKQIGQIFNKSEN